MYDFHASVIQIHVLNIDFKSLPLCCIFYLFFKSFLISRIYEYTAGIKSKFATHSIQGFSKYTKQVFIENYVSQYTRQNCYTCSRGNI